MIDNFNLFFPLYLSAIIVVLAIWFLFFTRPNKIERQNNRLREQIESENLKAELERIERKNKLYHGK